ncbi:LOW QUALITY PROTEIN: protein MRG1-like [Curcuma longa]|uniref:LOW QUALITY PROTEIN: protein MRG1-like n=1 Tax=Curcuma longa TaxID=136217 RepID=UPI003D9E84A4
MGSTNTGAGVKEETSADGDGGDNTNDASDPSAGGVFAEGEKVLAYHGPLIYEAKVQKAEIRKDEWRYFVHYLGWNKNWDEWVPADRLLKYTEENICKQQALEKNQTSEKNPRSGRSTQNKLKDAKVDREDLKSYVSKGKKRKVQSGLERPENLVKLQFPLTLKKQLVDEWELVTQLGKLVKLPRSPNVDEILKKYLDYWIKKDGKITESVGDILKGLRCYFDKALPAMLLYKKERQQYHEAIRDDVSPSTVYGAEHLLRLFVKLPELLACVNMEEEALAKLQQKLLDILRFLQKNQSSFFLSAYDGSSGGADESDAK